jgi:hypothetical protein
MESLQNGRVSFLTASSVDFQHFLQIKSTDSRGQMTGAQGGISIEFIHRLSGKATDRPSDQC